jgi:hypothetical protein
LQRDAAVRQCSMADSTLSLPEGGTMGAEDIRAFQPLPRHDGLGQSGGALPDAGSSSGLSTAHKVTLA